MVGVPATVNQCPVVGKACSAGFSAGGVARVDQFNERRGEPAEGTGAAPGIVDGARHGKAVIKGRPGGDFFALGGVAGSDL